MKSENNWMFGVDAILHSYSQIFFSLHKPFAAIILLVSFFNPQIGAFGLLSVLLVNAFAYLFGFKHSDIREGLFGFNALLLGLALAFSFELNTPFLVLFLIANICLLLLTAVFLGTFGKIHLPFLSFPFLVCYWVLMLASKDLSNLIQKQGNLSEMPMVPGVLSFLHAVIHALDHVPLPGILLVFFKTLAATFFQDSVLGGLLLAIGLFTFSRISFTLAFLGFCLAFWVSGFFGANAAQLSQNLVGSNYIFFAIAIGGFYLIPNIYSYLAVVFLVPILLLLQIAFESLFSGLHLKTFTLAFSVLTVLFLYAMHQRWLHQFLHLVSIQYYSAEKTVYKYLNAVSRFNHEHLKKITLPFWGDWQVSQGYDGNITHLGDWSKALDFVIVDEQSKTYKEPGVRLNDYYCYNKPVLAPADAYVYEIVNHIDDNEIGSVDTENNWGNSIILNHLDGLYSQISHIKRDSFKVAVGEFVSKGTILAMCGSSGRSPEPHVHFQLQNTPRVGAQTLQYPISCFIEKKQGKEIALKIFEVPEENSIICNVESFKTLTDAFDWAPGKTLRFYKENSHSLIEWEILTDAWNRLYVYDKQTKSYAYFVNDGTRFYFTDFEGSRNSDLFHLYMSCYSILLGAYPGLKVTDKLPLIHFNSPLFIWIQDFLAPFYLFTKAEFENRLGSFNQVLSTEQLKLYSSIHTRIFGKVLRTYKYQISIGANGIEEILMESKQGKEKWVCAGS